MSSITVSTPVLPIEVYKTAAFSETIAREYTMYLLLISNLGIFVLNQKTIVQTEGGVEQKKRPEPYTFSSREVPGKRTIFGT